MPSNAIKCHQKPSNAVNYRQMPFNAVKCRLMPSNAVKCRQIPSNAVNLLQMPISHEKGILPFLGTAWTTALFAEEMTGALSFAAANVACSEVGAAVTPSAVADALVEVVSSVPAATTFAPSLIAPFEWNWDLADKKSAAIWETTSLRSITFFSGNNDEKRKGGRKVKECMQKSL